MSLRSEVIRIINEVLGRSKKISEMDAAGALSGTELIEVVKNGVNMKTTVSQVGTGGGATAFTQLSDVPNSYTGQTLKILRVNAAETALEFSTGGGSASAFTDLTDVPASYSGQTLKAVRVNAGETGLEFYSSVPVITPETKTETNYTLVLSDSGKLIRMDSASTARTLTIPEDASVNFDVGTTITIMPVNAGTVTVATSGAATVSASNGFLTTTRQGVAWVLYKRAANIWEVWNGGAIPGGLLAAFYTDAGNTTTSETDLYSYTLSSGVLTTNGNTITGKFGGSYASAASTRRLRLYFAGTAIFDTGALTITGAATWGVEFMITRASGTAVRYVVTSINTGLTTQGYISSSELSSINLASSNILKITGQAGSGGANNDIVGKVGIVKLEF